jgi:hypothetical protein
MRRKGAKVGAEEGSKELIRKAQGKTIIPALRTASTTDLNTTNPRPKQEYVCHTV